MTTRTLTPDPASSPTVPLAPFASFASLAPGVAARAGTHHAHQPAPRAASTVPPRSCVPEFRPIRRGSGGRCRVRQAVRHRPGVLVTGLLAAATVVAAGPLRPGPAAPAAPAAPTSAQTRPQTATVPPGSPRCAAGR